MTLFSAPVQRVLLRKARWEVEKNISRLAADWRDRVAAGINELTHQAEKQALEELTALEQLAANSSSKAPDLKQAIEELGQFQNRLRGEPPAEGQAQNGPRPAQAARTQEPPLSPQG